MSCAVVPAILAALLLCGCSTFNYEWRKAAEKTMPTNDVAGRWEGRWVSEASGHNNRLRALIAPVDTNHFDVKFHADYKAETAWLRWMTIHFGYTVRMETAPGTNGIAFHGSEDLGALAGGVYSYKGHATPTNFFSTYKSKYDHGTFEMKRPEK